MNEIEQFDGALAAVCKRRKVLLTFAEEQPIGLTELARRVNRGLTSVCRSLKRPGCPKFEVLRRNGRGIAELRPNPALMAYLRK